MLRGMTFEQLTEWRVFDEIDPVGLRRLDYQAASICATVMNAAAIQARSKKRFRVKDFLLEYGDDKSVREGRRQTAQEMKMIARMIAAIPEEKKHHGR